ncbi:unnamed protein product [Phaedon cochleariae]|uniref:BACK domain-containing protein n=1 Tax=Phaedon cochleariae TaxID=80249 RepID=A0A9N9SHS3_PHACE|nr:unnamed protein product [Phaedon cochleariae]
MLLCDFVVKKALVFSKLRQNDSQVLEFIDEHGNEVLNLGSFTLLPQHVVRLILSREELQADEFTKFQAALMWGKKYCDSDPNASIKDVIGNFIDYIQFHKIPANALMRDIHPLGLVPYNIIVNALAYQHDGARPHFSVPVRNHLDANYPNRWIGRGGSVNWPPLSPDLNSARLFFMRSFKVKSS